MKKPIITLSFLFLVIFSCSDSENNDDSSPTSNFSNIVVFSNDDSNIYQSDILNQQNSENINLSSLYNLTVNLTQIEQNQDLVSIFERDFLNNNFNIYQYDVNSEETFILDQFCEVNNPESIFFPVATKLKLVMFTLQPGNNGFFNHKLKVYNKVTGICSEIELGNGIITQYETIVDNENLYVKLRIENNQYKLLKINLNINTVEDELIFDDNFWATTINNELIVGISNNQQKVYNKSNFEFLSNTSINFAVNFVNKLFNSKIHGDEIEVYIPYAQPGTISGAYGTLNLSTGEFVRGNNGYMYDVFQTLNAEFVVPNTSGGIGITTSAISLSTNEVIVGFRIFTSDNSLIGGIAYCDFDGNVNEVFELDSVPFHISIK